MVVTLLANNAVTLATNTTIKATSPPVTVSTNAFSMATDLVTTVATNTLTMATGIHIITRTVIAITCFIRRNL
jgi:hypothetical protein